MATGKVYYWLRLKKNFMTSDTVDFLMSQPEGANYVVLYQMLHLMSINTEGRLSRTIGDVIIPYDVKKIQRDTKWFTVDTINVALSLFMKLGLVYRDVDGVLVMADHKNLIGSETDYAEQKRVQRNEKASTKALPQECGQCPQPVHSAVHTEIRDKSIENRDEEIRDKNTNMSVSSETDCSTDVQRILDAWNSVEEIPKVQKLSPDSKRGRSLGARIKEYGVEKVLEAIAEIPESSFLTGKAKKQFKITFDWFVLPNNFPKVLEGNYRDGPKKVYAQDDLFYRTGKTLGNRVSRRLGLPEDTEETRQSYAAEMEACAKETGADVGTEIKDAIFFSQSDPFWQSRIVDAKSFRMNFRKILADMRRKEA